MPSVLKSPATFISLLVASAAQKNSIPKIQNHIMNIPYKKKKNEEKSRAPFAPFFFYPATPCIPARELESPVQAGKRHVSLSD
jgi:hypothetical protein